MPVTGIGATFYVVDGGQITRRFFGQSLLDDSEFPNGSVIVSLVRDDGWPIVSVVQRASKKFINALRKMTRLWLNSPRLSHRMT